MFFLSTSFYAQNHIPNPGFESGSSTYLWGGSTVVISDVFSGTYAARLDDNDTEGGGFEVTISGLSYNTKYKFSAYIKTSTDVGVTGVKNYGGSEIQLNFFNTAYITQGILFTIGDTDTSVVVYIYNATGWSNFIYAHDLVLEEVITSPPVNFIDNSGFETGLSSFLWGGSSVETNDVYSGTYAARLEDNTQ
jgi:hypothetical protein